MRRYDISDNLSDLFIFFDIAEDSFGVEIVDLGTCLPFNLLPEGCLYECLEHMFTLNNGFFLLHSLYALHLILKRTHPSANLNEFLLKSLRYALLKEGLAVDQFCTDLVVDLGNR